MLHISTRHFGDLEVDENKIITFASGIPGFPDLKKYILLNDPHFENTNTPFFFWLQSVEEGNIAFCLINLHKLMPEYTPLVDDEELESLGKYNPENFFIYNMVVISKNVKDITVNLKAPVVINTKLQRGKQVICQNDNYEIKHYLFR